MSKNPSSPISGIPICHLQATSLSPLIQALTTEVVGQWTNLDKSILGDYIFDIEGMDRDESAVGLQAM